MSRIDGHTVFCFQNSKQKSLAKFRQALLDYKQNGVALNVALARQGLDTVNGPDIRVASYAAEQVLAAEKEKFAGVAQACMEEK